MTFSSHFYLKVRPIQADVNRNATARPTRWIPAEVWQRQGMTAQVLTLPGGKFYAYFPLITVQFELFWSPIKINITLIRRCCNSNEFSR